MAQAFINPDILRWAMQRAFVGIERIAKKLGTNEERVHAWEQGKDFPTFRQAQNLAKALHIPFGYLFLDTPPTEVLPIPDLRTVRNTAVTRLSVDFKQLINDISQKRSWYVEYLREHEVGEAKFVGRFTTNSDYREVAADISSTLGVDDELRRQSSSWIEFLGKLTVKAEQIGIWVLRSGIVGNNTHRPLQVEEFRGFAISEKVAPLVFINSKDAKAAQIFTLVHEIAHLWIGQSGISNVPLEQEEAFIGNQTEVFCNSVAAEVLVPKAVFLGNWDDTVDSTKNFETLARFFRVSSVVIARRAMEMHLVDWDTYSAFYESERRKWIRQLRDSDGGDFYRTLKARNGTRFSRAVLSTAYEGKLLFREAATLLGTNVSNLEVYAKALGIR